MEKYRLSSYAISIELESEPDDSLLIHGYTGAIDLIDKSIVRFLIENPYFDRAVLPCEESTKDTLEKIDLVQKDENVKTFFDLDPNGISFVFNLNFLGTLIPTQVFAKDMAEKQKGTIIMITSMNAFRPLTRIPAYSAAKAAVKNFTEWMAVHFAPLGIRVNAIAPGFFSTKQNATLLWNEDGTPTERTGKILAATPMDRFGEPDELSGTLLFLCDDTYSGFITGVNIPVDGGFNAYSGV